MWFLFSKKEAKKEIKKLEDKIHNLEAKQEAEKERIANLDTKLSSNLARLEGEVLIINNFLNKSQSQSQSSIKQSQSNFETKVIQRIRKNKKSAVMSEINKLMQSHTMTEIFNEIVIEKGLCSRASFYRYLRSLKSQKINEMRLN